MATTLKEEEMIKFESNDMRISTWEISSDESSGGERDRKGKSETKTGYGDETRSVNTGWGGVSLNQRVLEQIQPLVLIPSPSLKANLYTL